jgi:hypothetical protein
MPPTTAVDFSRCLLRIGPAALSVGKGADYKAGGGGSAAFGLLAVGRVSLAPKITGSQALCLGTELWKLRLPFAKLELRRPLSQAGAWERA